MPKSNFNQFIRECEDYQTIKNNSIKKISIEPCADSCEDKMLSNDNNKPIQIRQQDQMQTQTRIENDLKKSNTFLYNRSFDVSSNTRNFTSCSNNIFLSKSINHKNKVSLFANANDANANDANANVKKNMFKNTSANQPQQQSQTQTLSKKMSYHPGSQHLAELLLMSAYRQLNLPFWLYLSKSSNHEQPEEERSKE